MSCGSEKNCAKGSASPEVDLSFCPEAEFMTFNVIEVSGHNLESFQIEVSV
jgi:hypothetical protein